MSTILFVNKIQSVSLMFEAIDELLIRLFIVISSLLIFGRLIIEKLRPFMGQHG